MFEVLEDAVSLLSQLVVAVSFACAAAGKLVLVDKPGAGPLEGEGRFVGLANRLLAPVEMVVAGLVVFAPAARWGALSACTLLLIFTIVLASRLLRGIDRPCGCYGRTQGGTSGRTAVVRNVLLAAASGSVITFGPTATSLQAQVGLVLIVAIVTETWLIIELKRQQQAPAIEEVAARGLTASDKTTVPPFILPDVAGGFINMQEVLAERELVVLVFVSPHCTPCHRILPLVAYLQVTEGWGSRCIVISEGWEASVAMRTAHGLTTVTVQEDFAVGRAFGVRGTPALAVIDRGQVREMALGESRVRDVLKQFTEEAAFDGTSA